jgi:predicted transcriptional regulator
VKKERTKTRYGVARRILRLTKSQFAITATDLVETYGFTYRHALRYIKWMQEEGLIYLRYRKNRYNYYSVVRRKHEVGKIK